MMADVMAGRAPWHIETGDVLDVLRSIPDATVRTCVTSPPYYGLRDYGLPPTTWADGWTGCLGLEPTPEQFITHLVEVMAEVRRVLTDEGTLWLNLGDSYAGSGKGPSGKNGIGKQDRVPCAECHRNPPNDRGPDGWHCGTCWGQGFTLATSQERRQGFKNVARTYDGIKAKDLIGIPWMAAFALRADGWYLRQDIIWSKPNPMPESVRDRCTRSHEYVFLLSKSPRYYYDADAVKEPCSPKSDFGKRRPKDAMPSSFGNHRARLGGGSVGSPDGRNRRDVWTINTRPFKGAHFATMPPALAEPCILAGSAVGDIVLDPFSGAATTGLVALQHGRRYIGAELNPEYAEMGRERLRMP